MDKNKKIIIGVAAGAVISALIIGTIVSTNKNKEKQNQEKRLEDSRRIAQTMQNTINNTTNSTTKDEGIPSKTVYYNESTASNGGDKISFILKNNGSVYDKITINDTGIADLKMNGYFLENSKIKFTWWPGLGMACLNYLNEDMRVKPDSSMYKYYKEKIEKGEDEKVQKGDMILYKNHILVLNNSNNRTLYMKFGDNKIIEIAFSDNTVNMDKFKTMVDEMDEKWSLENIEGNNSSIYGLVRFNESETKDSVFMEDKFLNELNKNYGLNIPYYSIGEYRNKTHNDRKGDNKGDVLSVEFKGANSSSNFLTIEMIDENLFETYKTQFTDNNYEFKEQDIEMYQKIDDKQALFVVKHNNKYYFIISNNTTEVSINNIKYLLK